MSMDMIGVAMSVLSAVVVFLYAYNKTQNPYNLPPNRLKDISRPDLFFRGAEEDHFVLTTATRYGRYGRKNFKKGKRKSIPKGLTWYPEIAPYTDEFFNVEEIARLVRIAHARKTGFWGHV